MNCVTSRLTIVRIIEKSDQPRSNLKHFCGWVAIDNLSNADVAHSCSHPVVFATEVWLTACLRRRMVNHYRNRLYHETERRPVAACTYSLS